LQQIQSLLTFGDLLTCIKMGVNIQTECHQERHDSY